MKEKELIKRFRGEVLAPLAFELLFGIKDQMFHTRPITEFTVFTQVLIRRALNGFTVLARKPPVDDVEPSILALAAGLILYDFNAMLPLNYPYVIALVDIQDERGVKFACIRRDLIPKNEYIGEKSIMPVLFVGTRADIVRGKLPKVQVLKDPSDYRKFRN